MNKGYTQSSVKKAEIASKMIPAKFSMNGTKGDSTATGGMKPKMYADAPSYRNGMKYKQTGPATIGGPGMKADLTNRKPSFSTNYTQNGTGAK